MRDFFRSISERMGFADKTNIQNPTPETKPAVSETLEIRTSIDLDVIEGEVKITTSPEKDLVLEQKSLQGYNMLREFHLSPGMKVSIIHSTETSDREPENPQDDPKMVNSKYTVVKVSSDPNNIKIILRRE